jgi:hypothetical protein
MSYLKLLLPYASIKQVQRILKVVQALNEARRELHEAKKEAIRGGTIVYLGELVGLLTALHLRAE